MNKKQKRIVKICIVLLLFVIGLYIYDSLTTYQVSYGPTYVEEKDGFIEMRISLASSSAYVHHYDLIEIDDGIYPGKVYKINNKDGHIKELHTVDGKVIYQKGG